GSLDHAGRFRLLRKQLIQSVDLHELQAGIFEDLLARYDREDLFHGAVGARVAIVPRIRAETAVLCDEAVIHSPGIDADAVQRQLAIADRDADRVLNLVPEPQRVPVERAKYSYRSIRKAVNLFDREPAVLQSARDGAAAFGAEIKRKILAHEK